MKLGMVMLPVLGPAARACLLAVAVYVAVDLRLIAIREFGPVVHEFDPQFQAGAAEYLHQVSLRHSILSVDKIAVTVLLVLFHQNGWAAFFRWFDHKSWYPLGRPIGSTIYPGLQLVAVGAWHVLHHYGITMSLNDVCAWTPVWFGAAGEAGSRI